MTDDEVGLALEMAEEAEIPTSIATFTRGTLPMSLEEGEVDPKSSDGKGIDHLFSGYGDQIVGIVFSIVGPPQTQA